MVLFDMMSCFWLLRFRIVTVLSCSWFGAQSSFMVEGLNLEIPRKRYVYEHDCSRMHDRIYLSYGHERDKESLPSRTRHLKPTHL